MHFASPRDLRVGRKGKRKLKSESTPALGFYDIDFAEVPEIAEKMVIGADDLVAMGFRPGPDHIELTHLGRQMSILAKLRKGAMVDGVYPLGFHF